MQKILLVDSVHPMIPEMLSGHGFVCEQFAGTTKEDLLGCIGEYEGVILRSKIGMDREVLDRAVSLKFIGRVGAGMENIDVEYATRKGIACLNSPEGNRDAVGEHALGMLLALMNHMTRADRQVRAGIWEREGNRGTELCGKTAGIIGYGHMGSAFAQRLKGFGCRVISYDKYKKDYSDGNTFETTLGDLKTRSDVVSLHVPLTEETRHMADDDFFNSFEKPIWLINTSRGAVVDTAALVRSLRSGKVFGAALDVLEYEDSSFEKLGSAAPPELEYLRTAENVLLTPHIAGWTHESHVKLARVLVEKILSVS